MAKHPTSVFCARSMALGAVLMLSCMVIGKIVIAPLFTDLGEASEQQVLGLVQESLATHSIFEPTQKDLLLASAAAMIELLDDPYAAFIAPDAVREFKEESAGTQIGIGLMLNSAGQVVFSVPNSDAAAQGIAPGDTILEIDGEDVSSATVTELLPLLRGRQSTTVKLKLRNRHNEIYEVEVKRQQIPRRTVTDSRIIDERHGIAHISITSFASSTPKEFAAALQRLDRLGMQALILDLRFNLGGQLNDAVEVVSHFLQGEVVCKLRPHAGEEYLSYADLQLSSHPSLPLVVLINELSASGSEIVAAALRDHQRATLMGTRTYGKGVFQKVLSFRDPDFALKFTAGYYLTPNGEMIEGNIHASDSVGGILPDVMLNAQSDEARNAIQVWTNRLPVPKKDQALVDELFPDFSTANPPDDSWLDAARDYLMSNK
ncbi:MAG: carboxyl-terminal processing protease [Myxococcota bacterium]|jgi:carboxyl-terminal processing protease